MHCSVSGILNTNDSLLLIRKCRPLSGDSRFPLFLSIIMSDAI